MSRKFTAKLFRKDLNLKDRWWHRLLLVIFFSSFIWALSITYTDLIDDSPYFPQWREVESVESRITPEVKRISELKRAGEGVAEKDSWYDLNGPDSHINSTYIDNFYCSSDLPNKIKEIQNRSGAYTLSGRGFESSNRSISAISDYLQEGGIKCLLADSYTYSTGVERFLRVVYPDQGILISDKDLSFYKKSNLLSLWFAIKMFSITIAIFVGLALAYYNVLLYIIFGKMNNKKNEKVVQ